MTKSMGWLLAIVWKRIKGRMGWRYRQAQAQVQSKGLCRSLNFNQQQRENPGST